MLRRSVLVIGGSSDIGRAIILKYINNGFNIIATSNNGTLDDMKNICDEKNVDFYEYKLNVLEKSSFKALFDYVKSEIDYLDCIVYCAGISKSEKLLMDEKLEDIDEIIDVNLKGAIYCGKYAMDYFSRKKGGSIIYISSIYGIYGGACESAYSASKGGLIALTKAMAQECASFNLRVNCVAPGFIDTKMTERFNEDERIEVRKATPLARLGEGNDVANAVYFLASEDASFITGETITVSGGAIKF